MSYLISVPFITEIEFGEFSFKVPIHTGETHNVLRSDDIEGGKDVTIIIHNENGGSQFLCMSSRSITMDCGAFYRDMKPLLLLCEMVGVINDIISLSLQTNNFISKEFKRSEKVCDSDNALIYQADVLCDFEQYTRYLLVSIGVMNHLQYSYYFICINIHTDADNEWDKFFAWNKCLAVLQ